MIKGISNLPIQEVQYSVFFKAVEKYLRKARPAMYMPSNRDYISKTDFSAPGKTGKLYSDFEHGLSDW